MGLMLGRPPSPHPSQAYRTCLEKQNGIGSDGLPTQRVGKQACPFTTLYWDFLDRNQESFAGNHRMAQQFAGMRKLSDIDKVRTRAQEVLTGLSTGEI